jgi:hypothetical protein
MYRMGSVGAVRVTLEMLCCVSWQFSLAAENCRGAVHAAIDQSEATPEL